MKTDGMCGADNEETHCFHRTRCAYVRNGRVAVRVQF